VGLHIHFPLRKLFLWLSVYACLFGIVAGLPVPTVQIVAATTIVTVFVIMDLRYRPEGRNEVPTLAHCSIVLAYYASAFAVSVAVCYGLHEITPEPPVAPTPPQSLFAALAGLLELLYGDSLGDSIGREIMIVMTYYWLFTVFSAVVFCSSFFSVKHYQVAKWFLLLSSPGMCLFVYFLVLELAESANG
jgi:hypothetical protein